MLRTLLKLAGLLVAWTLLILMLLMADAMWLYEPPVVPGDARSIAEHFQRELSTAAQAGSFGAASAALIQEGRIASEFSYASPERAAADDERKAVFQVGSVSKSVTAFGAMKLVQDGAIGLDEPVFGHMKRWRFAGSNERKERITLRHLLSHTSGIDDPPGYTGFGPDERVGTLEDYLSEVRVAREPGTAFSYGNAASAVVQLLIEDITGEPFAAYMKANVFDPLEMTDSTFVIENAEGLTPAYDASVVPQEPRRHSIVSAVALYTNARDLSRFASALQGSNPVLSDESLGAMRQAQPGTSGNWGLGLRLFSSNGADGHLIGHDGGAIPAWGAAVRINPASGNAMALTVSGGRGSVNQLPHDWAYWETGIITREARTQYAFGRLSTAAMAIGIGATAIALVFLFLQVRSRGFMRSSRSHVPNLSNLN